MDAAVAASKPDASMFPWAARHTPPDVELTPFTRAELDALFRGGELEADLCERLLAVSSRARGGIEVAIAEGLDALRHGDRLARLGYHLDDYAREVLDLGKRAAESLAHLGAALRTRPGLREALRSGRVGLRAAQTILPVAVGDMEALWVERAAHDTVRELEEAVRRCGHPEETEEDWLRLRTHLPPDERTVVDVGLDLAGLVMPGSTTAERVEAFAQEYLGAFSTDDGDDETRPLGPAFAPLAPGDGPRRAALEAEMERWRDLPAVAQVPTPDVHFDDTMTAQEIDRILRTLASIRARWEHFVGVCAHAIRGSGIHRRLGFHTFRHYVEERLRLPPRAVEQRAVFEEKVAQSPALQEARRQKVSYERLRLLARLPEDDIRAWIARAKAMTCIALQRAVQGEKERHMRARRKLSLPLPRRVAALLVAAAEAVRARVGRPIQTGSCLTVMVAHFVDQWKWVAERSATRSQKIRERALGFCQVPGCSHRAVHAHHKHFRSHGGGDEPENLVALCAFHHLRCIHGGYLSVFGRAPDGLTWLLGGEPFTGMA